MELPFGYLHITASTAPISRFVSYSIARSHHVIQAWQKPLIVTFPQSLVVGGVLHVRSMACWKNQATKLELLASGEPGLAAKKKKPNKLS
jgi:hypothetical protein